MIVASSVSLQGELPFTQLVLATHNPGKLQEYKGVFQPYGIEIFTAKDLNVPEPLETGSTFKENAELKARHASSYTGHVALSDDGGLCIPSLGGHPGLHSGRWAKKMGGFPQAHAKLEEMTQGKSREAFFQLVLALHDPRTDQIQFFEGKRAGRIDFPARGEAGFGYDPIFIPEGYDQTISELGMEVKRQISARAKALQALVKTVFETE